jgi:hypothetical protein
MAFVNVSRTAMVTMPVMLAAFALLHLRARTSVTIFCVAAILVGLAFAASPQLRNRASLSLRDYQLYMESDIPTSLGLRLEYWRKSLRFFAEAPLAGHGTGSPRQLFERAATGSEEFASAQIVSNPHNQTLNVAVQWGIVGVAILYAMWLAHLLLFRGEGMVAWIGLLVVVQNFCTSLFNSHLFDFHEGWIYVLGTGVAGGMILRQHASAKVMPQGTRLRRKPEQTRRHQSGCPPSASGLWVHALVHRTISQKIPASATKPSVNSTVRRYGIPAKKTTACPSLTQKKHADQNAVMASAFPVKCAAITRAAKGAKTSTAFR